MEQFNNEPELKDVLIRLLEYKRYLIEKKKQIISEVYDL